LSSAASSGNAIHTTRKRLIGVQRELKAAGKPFRAFEVLNLGRYERQREVIDRTIKFKNLNCLKIYEIADVSGTNVRNAPEIQEILRLVENRNVSGVVVADLDRLLRPDRFEDFSLLQVFQDSGAILYCGSTELDLSTKDGFLTGGIRASIAGFELRLIKERMLGAKEEKRRQGKCPSAAHTLPLGVAYDRKAGKFHYAPEVAKVAEAFRLVDEVGITNYCELSRRTGIHHRTLHNLLRNPIYIGIRRYDKKCGKEKYTGVNGRQSGRKKVLRSATEVIEVRVIERPAVDPSRFQRVQDIIGGIRNGWHRLRQDDKTINLAVGIAYCGYCGDRLYCSSGKRKGHKRQGYYFCKRNHYLFREKLGGCQMRPIPQPVLDETLRKFTAERLGDPEVVKAIARHHFQSKNANSIFTSQPGPADLVEQLNKKLTRWSEAYDKGAIDLDEFSKRIADIQRQIEVVKAMKPIPAFDGDEAAWNEVLRLLVLGARAFARLKDRKLQRQTVVQLLARVTFKDEKLTSFQLNRQFLANCRQTGMPSDTDSSPPRA
jgi:DNA invertase Pin-like site-specific DNA recombinase